MILFVKASAEANAKVFAATSAAIVPNEAHSEFEKAVELIGAQMSSSAGHLFRCFMRPEFLIYIHILVCKL